MIVDRIEQWRQSFTGAATACVAEFLVGLTAGVADGEYPLEENGIVARVMTYQTRVPEETRLEAHRAYVDVQTLLAGREAIEWFPVEDLIVETPYDPERDVVFYHVPGPAPARVEVAPGTFAVFFPRDAHRPQLTATEGLARVRKVVVKIPVRLGVPGW